MRCERNRVLFSLLSGLILMVVVLGACGQAGNERISKIDGKVMVRIPAGTFLMGSQPDERDAAKEEQPQHEVYVDEFWIDKTETTNAQYRQCVEAGECRPPERDMTYAGADYYSDEAFDAHPVIWVSWDDANTYCKWAGKRLPTEAEWEKAARGTEPRRYPWGDEWPDGRLVNLCDVNCGFDYLHADIDDKYAETSPVGNYPEGANPYGLLDMAGNVWEWVSDWYAEDYYSWTTTKNPQGPQYGDERVIRGGAWNMWQLALRTAARNKELPRFTYPNVGIRCVSDK